MQIFCVKYIVEKTAGEFVFFLRIAGCTPPTTYTMTTADIGDAHDFKTRSGAEKWIRENKAGKVVEITDEGYWPLTD